MPKLPPYARIANFLLADDSEVGLYDMWQIISPTNENQGGRFCFVNETSWFWHFCNEKDKQGVLDGLIDLSEENGLLNKIVVYKQERTIHPYTNNPLGQLEAPWDESMIEEWLTLYRKDYKQKPRANSMIAERVFKEMATLYSGFSEVEHRWQPSTGLQWQEGCFYWMFGLPGDGMPGTQIRIVVDRAYPMSLLEQWKLFSLVGL